MIRVTVLMFLLLGFVSGLTGCLKTRAELRGDSPSPDLERQTVAQQQAQAAAPKKAPPVTNASRFEEYDQDMRQLNGRVDEVENMVNQYNAAAEADKAARAQDKQALEQKFALYEDALKKMDQKIQDLIAEVQSLKTAPPAATATTGKGAHASTADLFGQGESAFSAKKWKEAIVSYQKFRDKNPKSKKYPEATYKIGVAFQELGMKEEARTFYEDVASKHPHTKEGKKAAFRLKTLK